MAQSPLTVTTALVLREIAAGCRYGFDLMERTGLPSGTVYPALRRLEKTGMVAASWEAGDVARREGRPRRRYYRVTAAGLESLQTARARYPFLDATAPAAAPEGAPS